MNSTKKLLRQKLNYYRNKSSYRFPKRCFTKTFEQVKTASIHHDVQNYVTLNKQSKYCTNEVVALDCEKILVEKCWHDGTKVVDEVIGRVTIINEEGDVIYDEVVKPEHDVKDAKTRWSGLTEKQLKAATKPLKKIQQDLMGLLDQSTIICGHDVQHDLKALKIKHDCIFDTSIEYPHPKPGDKLALKKLIWRYFRIAIQVDDGSGHDSAVDALAALLLRELKVCSLRV